MLDDWNPWRIEAGSCMTPREVRATQPAARPADHRTALAAARQRMLATGQWSASQLMGRRWPIGCVALEITQRCNLDCTACYLSEHSEAIRDIPLEEIERRLARALDGACPGRVPWCLRRTPRRQRACAPLRGRMTDTGPCPTKDLLQTYTGRVIKLIDRARQRVLGIFRALPQGGGRLSPVSDRGERSHDHLAEH